MARIRIEVAYPSGARVSMKRLEGLYNQLQREGAKVSGGSVGGGFYGTTGFGAEQQAHVSAQIRLPGTLAAAGPAKLLREHLKGLRVLKGLEVRVLSKK